jgi:hypothetical protein
MCLFIESSIYAYSGGTLVRAHERMALVVRQGQVVDRFAVEAPIEWLKISPDGRTVLIYSHRATRISRWREGSNLERFLEASDSRDRLGCGFIVMDGSIITLVSKNGTLRGLTAEDRDLFASNLRSPHSIAPRSFVQLPGNRLALTGAFFSDPCDVVITMSLDELLRDPEAVQQAIPAKAPVWDRAIHVAVGPCGRDAAVVLRDPEDQETPDEDEDDEDRRDVENFTGVYIRQLDSSALVERHAYAGRASSGAAIVASSDWIVTQVVGGVDMIRRSTGAVQHLPGVILDVRRLELVKPEGDVLTSVTPIDQVVL